MNTAPENSDLAQDDLDVAQTLINQTSHWIRTGHHDLARTRLAQVIEALHRADGYLEKGDH